MTPVWIRRMARGPRPVVLATVLLGNLATASLPTMAEPAGESGLGRTAVARQAAEWDRDGKPVKLEFDFGDFKGWVRKDGFWGADGFVHHRGLLCGTYSLMLRLGNGTPGCTDVKWFREPRAVASVTLCNNASGPLKGGNTEFADARRFDQITCAERTIRCTGNCK